ncbi:hypothetical protein K4K58_002109 [Colletotrichum sp. SAR11_239]|nr:hypothetical protein K4K58_002109 [Colletotrichum sp. SAR11_239]
MGKDKHKKSKDSPPPEGKSSKANEPGNTPGSSKQPPATPRSAASAAPGSTGKPRRLAPSPALMLAADPKALPDHLVQQLSQSDQQALQELRVEHSEAMLSFYEKMRLAKTPDRPSQPESSSAPKANVPMLGTVQAPEANEPMTGVSPTKSKANVSVTPIEDEPAAKRLRFEDAELVYREALRAKKAALEVAKKEAILFKENVDEQRIRINRPTFDKHTEDLELATLKLERDVAIMNVAQNQLIGAIMDKAKFDKALRIIQENDWHYIDFVIGKIKLPGGATVAFSSFRKDTFNTSLYEAYGAKDPEKDEQWCVLTWKNTQHAVAAHIVNHNVGEVCATAFFGESTDGHLDHPRNGLPMHKDLELCWDQGYFVIVPATDSEGRLEEGEEYQVVVLDSQAERSFEDVRVGGPDPFAKLNGRRLVFNNDFRPSRRYLYFKYVTTILRRERFKVPRAVHDRSKIGAEARKLWASPGSYLERSTLFRLSRQLGWLTEDEAMQFWQVPFPPTSGGEDDDTAATVANAITQSLVEGEMPNATCKLCGQRIPGGDDDQTAVTMAMTGGASFGPYEDDGEGGVEDHLKTKVMSKKEKKKKRGKVASTPDDIAEKMRSTSL